MTVEGAKEFALRFGWPLGGKKFPLAIGHRGASGHATENTLTAFAKASDLGAEMWELDTQLTKDGICVVSHDDHLQRVFGLDRRISELTAAELATLEGACVPTFAAVAALVRERNAGLYVELKADGTGPIVLQEFVIEQHIKCAVQIRLQEPESIGQIGEIYSAVLKLRICENVPSRVRMRGNCSILAKPV